MGSTSLLSSKRELHFLHSEQTNTPRVQLFIYYIFCKLTNVMSPPVSE